MQRVKSANQKLIVGIIVIALLFTFILGIATFSRTDKALATGDTVKKVNVVHMTDIHVMPDNYCNPYSIDFQKATQGNSKLLEQSSSVLLTALDEIYEMPDDEAPMYILVSGDLTSNGEYEAHLLVAEAYRQLTTKMRAREGFENFQVFIIPGNHDMYNDASVSYMPTSEELATFKTNYVTENELDLENVDDYNQYQEALRTYLTNYPKRYVKTATSEDMFKIYGEFGYNKDSAKLADNISVKYFIDSQYWYEPGQAKVEYNDDGSFKSSQGLDTVDLTDEEYDAWKSSGKNFELITKQSKIGACSYIAETPEYTFVCVDGSARIYDKKMENIPELEANWNETTGGVATRAMIKWIVAETRADVEANKLVLTQCHFNVVPHFDAEDEVISLFTLDNWEEFSYTLANNGLRYVFTGHQHANDIVYYTTQTGEIIYDFETCSAISYGSSYRSLVFTQTTKDNGEYYEDVKTTTHIVNYNNGSNDTFAYGMYFTKKDIEESGYEILEYTPVTKKNGDSIFEGVEHLCQKDLYGKGDIFFARVYAKDRNGDNVGIADYLAEANAHMFEEMVAKFVNDSIFDMLRGMINKSLTSEEYRFSNNLINTLIDQLSEFDVYEFKKDTDGKFFTLSATPKAGYSLVDYVNDLADWLLNYDFSYGEIQGGKTLSDIFLIVYGGHLTGAGNENMDEEIIPLIENLHNGNFVKFLINTLVQALIPQVDLILNAPIRVNENTAVLTQGKGFDIVDAMDVTATSIFSLDNTIKTAVNVFLVGDGTTADANGYMSIKLVLKDLVDSMFVKNPKELTGAKKTIVPTLKAYVNALSEGIISKIIKYVKIYANSDLMSVVQTELLDKYVTDSFCRNLGRYAEYLITSFDVDTYADGSSWISKDNLDKKLNVANTANFNVTIGTSLQGHAYYKSNTFDGKLEVTPTAENGLLPNMISVSFSGGSIQTEKTIKFVTSLEVDVFNPNSVPDATIVYSKNENFADAKEVKPTNKQNVVRELPTIDLGILYFNMNYRARTYNVYEETLKNLEPGTTYYYKLRNANGDETPVYVFKTAPSDIQEFSFMAITDIQGSYENNYLESAPDLEKAFAYEEIGSKASFIVSCGDNVDNGKNFLQYSWWLNDQVKVWANQTLVSMAGNHEDNSYDLSSVIALPSNAKVQESGYYYSYNYGSAHFVIIDTNNLTNNMIAETQYNWLVEDLNNNTSQWTIVMLHKGLQTAGSHAFDDDVIAMREQLMPIFAKYGVDLVLQGHDHTYSVSDLIDYKFEVTQEEDEDGDVYEVENHTKQVNKLNLYESNNQGNGVLYINLGTMGDKFYNYLYSEEVNLVDRDDVDDKINKYLKDGKLELTETPAFANIVVSDKELKIETYTIVDGEVVKIDSINMLAKTNNVSKTNLIIAIVLVSVFGAGIIAFAVFFIVKKVKMAKMVKKA
ncbi:MAG: metallophosphoesterase [Clostridia bacterium]|nr:metallophosphoesterase [Clostridia bacterium]